MGELVQAHEKVALSQITGDNNNFLYKITILLDVQVKEVTTVLFSGCGLFVFWLGQVVKNDQQSNSQIWKCIFYCKSSMPIFCHKYGY